MNITHCSSICQAENSGSVKKVEYLAISCTTNVLTIVKTIAGFKMCYLIEAIKSNGPVSMIAPRGLNETNKSIKISGCLTSNHHMMLAAVTLFYATF